ncbi:helix-turn-helix domain-containing protein [Chitinophaga solisilvae]|uniref:helix-turn-helix domain-containing protein n=1 Tax=Chitinophaga solisilvae TaxID=1233460 RepID=UPI001370E94C|nr:AraC family transcriptional regulator [Chitinophaga solisilvae]
MRISKSQILALAEVRRFIDQEPSRRFSIRELVQHSGLSEDKLTRRFKELYQVSIYHHQLHVAMGYAAELLQQGELVKTVAITLGYKTPGNFSRAFYRVFQKYPSEIKPGA